MSVALVKDLIHLLDIKASEINNIPCVVALDEQVNLAVLMTDFEHLSFTLILQTDTALTWSDSDIVEYFIDEDTQVFIEKYQAVFSKTRICVGYSVSVKTEKTQLIELSEFVRDGTQELIRFLKDFTAC